jgi:hypothetical protein
VGTSEGVPPKSLQLMTACLIFGGAYGACYGAAWGSLMFSLGYWEYAASFSVKLTFFRAVVIAVYGGAIGAAWGAAVGAAGGLIAGVVGVSLGARLGGHAVAVLGGLAPGLLLVALRLPHLDLLWNIFVIWVPALVAALLGCAVARALRTGRSCIPGVPHLMRVVNEVRPQGGTRSSTPLEIVPSEAPTGRGDETMPAG